LLGSKPVTTFEILDIDENADETKLEYPPGHDYRIFLNRDELKDREFYNTLSKEQQKHAYLFPEKDYIFDDFSLWQAWQERGLPASKKYLLFARKMSDEELAGIEVPHRGGYEIYFINVAQTACLLQKHYSLFTKLFDGDFDPVEETLKMTDSNSPLILCLMGKHPKGTHVERGLLHGFGWENSQLFTWKVDKDFSGYDEGAEDSFAVLDKKKPFTPENFSLPAFMVSSPLDPQKLRYEEERRQIQEFYRGKDFVKATLSLLTDSKDS